MRKDITYVTYSFIGWDHSHTISDKKDTKSTLIVKVSHFDLKNSITNLYGIQQHIHQWIMSNLDIQNQYLLQ